MAASIKVIKGKIQATKKTAQITKAMNMISASKLKSAENAIKRYRNLMTIHTHPNSYPPSIADMNSSFYNGYVLGLVVCHDGSIYQYCANEKLDKSYHDLRVAKHKANGYNEIEAQRLELEEIRKRFDVKFQEVTVDDVL